MIQFFGGKTSPRICFDIRSYSPPSLILSRRSQGPNVWQNGQEHFYNPLKDPPAGYDEHTGNAIGPARGSCLHVYGNKLPQSIIPAPDQLPQNGTVWQYAAVCQHCRWHLQVQATFRPLADSTYSYCPSKTSPLHHFILDTCQIAEESENDINSGMETYYFRCISCPCSVLCRILPPRLDDSSIELLVADHRLQQRYEQLKAEDPDRKGVVPQRAIQVLEALYAYLRDSLKTSTERKKIPKANRRFKLSLGTDCDDFLRWLGFDDSADASWWELPRAPESDPLSGYNQRNLIEDVCEELLVLIRRWSGVDRQTLKQISSVEWAAAVDNGLERILFAATYDKIPVTRMTSAITEVEEHAYAALGVLWDFSDDLLVFSFNKQIECDQRHSIFYFDSLLAASSNRSSEYLQVSIATMASQGFISSSNVTDAYSYFAIDARAAASLVDEHILGIFRSRLADSPPDQEAELRKRLRVIGQARGSSALTDAADYSFQNEEQALRQLDPNYDPNNHLSDDQVISVAVARISELRKDENRVRDILRYIAEKRHSLEIQRWLDGDGPSGAGDDDVAAAYKFFGVTDRNAEIELALLDMNVDSKIQDGASEAEAHKHADMIRRYQQAKAQDVVHSRPNWNNPMGLTNMGNTCYLNSLLQFLFTIEPLRDLVLNFDLHKADISSGSFRPKNIIITKAVSRKRVAEAQEFVSQLQKLFEKMAHEPGETVSPTWGLAKLALISEDQEEERAIALRRSTITGERPFQLGLAEVDEKAETLADVPEANCTADSSQDLGSLKANDRQRENGAPSPESQTITGDNASETTLINEPGTLNGTDDVAMSDTGEELSRIDSGLNAEPPTRPPPPPPKPKHSSTETNQTFQDHTADYRGKEALKKAVEDVAQQQDVFEVISKILYKIMYAIEPEGEDSHGYQLDRVRDLFFGNRVWRFLPKVTDDSEDTWYSLELPLHSAPKDVYELLDAEMDIAEVTLNGKPAPRYSTFTKLPPIMQMCLGRQGFEGGRAFVLKHHVELNEVIYMDRYMDDGAPDILERRQASWALKARLRSLQATREALSNSDIGLNASETLEAAYQWVENMGDDILVEEVDTTKPDGASSTTDVTKQGLLNGLKAESDEFRLKLESLDREIRDTTEKLEDLFADLTNRPYELAAVFVHRGQDRAGHYWVYIRDFAAGIWRRYEDHRVTDVRDTTEIFRKGDPQTDGAPYLLAYVETSRKDQLLQPLYRSPKSTDSDDDNEAGPPTHDTDMRNAALHIHPVRRVDSIGEISQTPILEEHDTTMHDGEPDANPVVINGVDPDNGADV